MNSLELQLCDIQVRLFELSGRNNYDSECFIKAFMLSDTAKRLDMKYNRLQWAGEEYLLRVNRMLYSCAQNLCNKNPYIDITYAFSQLQKVAITAIDIFDPNYGKPFVNLLRAMIKICSLSIGKTTAISYQRSMNNFGRKVEYFDCVLSDSAADGNKMAREIINRLDLEMFLETLPPDKQELLVLYSHGLTFREISEAIHVPLSTVSYWIYKLIEQAKGFFGIE